MRRGSCWRLRWILPWRESMAGKKEKSDSFRRFIMAKARIFEFEAAGDEIVQRSGKVMPVNRSNY